MSRKNAVNADSIPEALMFNRLAHRNKFRIGYHIISSDPNEGGRQIHHHTGGTILDAINSLLQAYRGVSADSIVLDDCCEE